MNKFQKTLLGASCFLFFVASGILIFLFLVDESESVAQSEVNKKVEFFYEKEAGLQRPATIPSNEPIQTLPGSDSLPATREASATISEEMMADPVSEILSRSDEDFASTVNQLLAAMPKLNPEQQVEAAQHIANLSDDALAAQWSQKMIVQSLPQPASELLFNDLLNRPHELLMPFLSKLADMPQHSQSTQSVEILEVLFGQPPAGTKWEKWVKNKAQEAP